MALKDKMMSYITEEEISEMIKNLAREIEMDYAGEEILLVCPLKGSAFFVADLMREIKLNQQVDFVYVTNKNSETGERGGDIKFLKDISSDISKKNVLIVEEIIDTGRTLSFLKNRLLASGPKSLKIVCLLDKPARRVISIKPDYVGRTIEDRYVVGYGMDEDELGRNYREIYHLKN
ncbi:MAG: hypoxanthine phosphoribosyltransferase [Bdellovibrionota bacterium]|nr:hypoxanthine phosphoribosyltransferase [Bdellovibrionota bacterium]